MLGKYLEEREGKCEKRTAGGGGGGGELNTEAWFFEIHIPVL